MARAVLDASAVIALIRREPGADVVESYVDEALISTVTMQEVLKSLLLRGVSFDVACDLLESFNLETRAHEVADAYAAASLYDATKTKGSGLGDRTCMALAIAEGLPVITTDKAWSDLAIPGLSVIQAR